MCDTVSSVFRVQASGFLAQGLGQPGSLGLAVPIPSGAPWHPSEGSGQGSGWAPGGFNKRGAWKQGGLWVSPAHPSTAQVASHRSSYCRVSVSCVVITLCSEAGCDCHFTGA